ncbi:hypothetical protein [Pseudomonas sp. HMWF006]|uniref:hypothetical protein n=1 Tax=Pseudomonas sp. HMWF006 TaxID=2056843 RepID=UPI000D44D63C|nr:hypothetical protein [Pseudomonas sp. HMWF006]PTT02205.1 hypothetical protein DBR24_07270 [Pseudomonas sp. HMWF006]PTT72881.1 hypothetical protein DBR26_04240 [Pseudomonas sp. HMWF007]PTT94648.1 hypothetical protein DBR29_02840 [Pseudomonas sp. HMWF005]
MNLTSYTYTGPRSAVSIRVGETRELLNVQLLPGKPIELPAEHEYTLVLLELKYLALSPSPTKAAGKSAAVAQKPERE